MSCITENTIVMKASDEDQFLKEVEQYEGIHRLSGVVKVFKNNDIAVYVFDCNGDSPWEVESDTIAPIILETNYGDGDGYWTRLNGNDVSETCRELLQNMLTETEFKSLEDAIEYTF